MAIPAIPLLAIKGRAAKNPCRKAAAVQLDTDKFAILMAMAIRLRGVRYVKGSRTCSYTVLWRSRLPRLRQYDGLAHLRCPTGIDPRLRSFSFMEQGAWYIGFKSGRKAENV